MEESPYEHNTKTLSGQSHEPRGTTHQATPAKAPLQNSTQTPEGVRKMAPHAWFGVLLQSVVWSVL